MEPFEPPTAHEETLDPSDWDAVAALVHRAVDESLHYLRTVRERPVWQPVPPDVRRALREPVPRAPQGLERTYDEYVERIRPYPAGNLHPRCWGWVNGNGTPDSALADFLIAINNTNAAGWDQSATYVEEQVLGWLSELYRFPEGTGGLFVSGCSMGNAIALAAAREARLDFDVRREGLSAASKRPVLYASAETHSSVAKGVEFMGLGSDALRRVPTGADFRIDTGALCAAIARDREAGLHPFAVVANAGTVNTGAIDDLAAIADIAEREQLWFHVDGAFGALAILDSELAVELRGIERADSLAFDLHKWMCLSYEVGCVLVRHPGALEKTFSAAPSYLSPLAGGFSARGTFFAGRGPQLSRGFRALKVWMALKSNGLDRYARLVRQNVDQARFLAQRIAQSDRLSLAAPVSLNVVCFRYAPDGLDREALEAINRAILVQLQESGVAMPSSTVLNGDFALRAAIVNHRSRRSDFEFLAAEVERLGDEFAATLGSAVRNAASEGTSHQEVRP